MNKFLYILLLSFATSFAQNFENIKTINEAEDFIKKNPEF